MNVVFLIFLTLSSPQMLLSEGNTALQAGRWQEAADKFNEVIVTSRLNSAGQALSYWNVFVCEDKLGNENNKMHALLGFIVYGSDAIKTGYPSYMNWAKEFDVYRKLSFAFVLIQAKWASKNNYSCRNELYACYIEKESLISIFDEEIPFCHGRENIISLNVNHKNNMLIANVQCKPNTTETYYFRMSNEL